MRSILSKRNLIALIILLALLALLAYFACVPDAKASFLSRFSQKSEAAPQAVPTPSPTAFVAANAAPSETPDTDRALTLQLIDVGQGSAALLISPSGKSLLLDTGEAAYAPAVRNALRAQGVAHLDLCILSHLHSDHAGALPALIKAYPPAACFMPPCELSTSDTLYEALQEAGVEVHAFTAGMPIPWDEEVVLTVLSPLDHVDYPNENEGSLMLHVRYGDTAILFAGDTGAFAEDAALRAFPEEAFRAELLIAGHHGSSTSTTPRFLRAVSPRYAAVSCGQNNSYGHPHQSVLNLLEKQGVQLYRTDLNGDCIFRLDGESVTVESAK